MQDIVPGRFKEIRLTAKINIDNKFMSAIAVELMQRMGAQWVTKLRKFLTDDDVIEWKVEWDVEGDRTDTETMLAMAQMVISTMRSSSMSSEQKEEFFDELGLNDYKKLLLE